MNWEIVASTGEWAGAIAVVASLLYLARQIRATNQQSRSAARYSFLDAYGKANAAISESLQSDALRSKPPSPHASPLPVSGPAGREGDRDMMPTSVSRL